jgi:hypothetical protein
LDYPKWEYTQGNAVVVEHAEAEAALVGTWYDSPADVPAPVPVVTEDEQLLIDAKAEKEQLLAECAAHGISVDKRWGIAKLKEVLTAAQVPPVPVA